MAGKAVSFHKALKTMSSNSRASFLNDWKKDGQLIVFLHTASGIATRRRHTIPYADVDDNGQPKIKYMNFVCMEDPEDYDIENPVACPVEMFMSYLINNPSIADDTVVWEAATGGRYDRFVTKRDFIDEGDWKNSFKSRPEIIMALINAEAKKPEIQIATETIAVWYALRKAIEDQIISDGEELGDPALNPYAFRFTYDAKAAPKDKYAVGPFRRANVTPVINELLNSPDVGFDAMLKSKGVRRLREIFEASVQIHVDFDLIFGEAMKFADKEDGTDFDTDELEKEAAPKTDATAEQHSPLDAEAATVAAQDDSDDDADRTPCETCAGKGTFGKKKTTCPDCDGEGYEDVIAPFGSGQDNDDDEPKEIELIDCETCGGKGTIGKKKTECPDCEGEGRVPSEDAQICYDCEKLVPLEATSCPFCRAEFATGDDE